MEKEQPLIILKQDPKSGVWRDVDLDKLPEPQDWEIEAVMDNCD